MIGMVQHLTAKCKIIANETPRLRIGAVACGLPDTKPRYEVCPWRKFGN
jgi:hypothetical protein